LFALHRREPTASTASRLILTIGVSPQACAAPPAILFEDLGAAGPLDSCAGNGGTGLCRAQGSF
jgi:hypothetical protein